jgi:hypothetical protein
MNELRYTLLSDGSSDRAMLPVLTWLVQQHLTDCAINSQWADLGRLRTRPKTLAERIRWSVKLYPCDLLFVHRDAERESRLTRVTEVLDAHREASQLESIPPVICVVPVRMTEAWLLFDESALRRAADNPNGRQPLVFPRVHELETLPNPKAKLGELWREASGLAGRRRARLRVWPERIAGLIDDFSVLRRLSAFEALEADLKLLIAEQDWRT